MATAQAESTIPTGIWQSDPIHSSVGFAVKHVVGTFRGTFDEFAATLTDTDGSPKLSGRAKVEGLQVKDQNLYAHLLSPEFFDAERHPVVGFSGALKRDGDAVEIDGEITLKGITQPAVLKGTIVGPTVDHFGATRVGLKLQTTVDRTKFDMNWNMPLPNGEPALSNEVTLKADLTLVAQEA
jgi:polyisoprenoid-binding protein YceI